jgi:hypothetical protein
MPASNVLFDAALSDIKSYLNHKYLKRPIIFDYIHSVHDIFYSKEATALPPIRVSYLSVKVKQSRYTP